VRLTLRVHSPKVSARHGHDFRSYRTKKNANRTRGLCPDGGPAFVRVGPVDAFCGGAYSDFKFYPHVLFLPATLVAFVFGASDAGLRTALFCEAFLICFAAIAFAYFLVAYLYRREPA
jgi:hypothetical protein